MGVYSWLLLLLSVCWLLPHRGCRGSRILVVPVDGSHWVNMEVLVRELHSRGHHLTVLRPSDSWFIAKSAPHYDSITVMMGESEVGLGFFHGMVGQVLEARKRGPVLRFLHQQKELAALLRIAHRATCRMLTTLLEDHSLVAQLKDTQFDLMLTDPAMPAGTVLAHYLHLPLVYNARWTSFGEGHFEIAPSPPSYVPVPGSELGDHMGLRERARNLLQYATNFLQERLVILPLYRELLRLHFPPGADLPSMQRAADLWLMRTDFVFEFPRPTMPNVVYMGGFQCRPPRPLPPELEEFMQSSGEHGVVVMSLGTLISALPMEITERIAAALARLPQKVVWRYVGKKPSTLGNNTLLLDWLPQNDLLGHPKTRAFLAHGGTNGLYEAIYHGVPVLGLPLLFDQFDNVLRLQLRGAARVLEAATLSTEEVLEALQGVLENPSYRHSMQRLSRLHRDRPLSPLHSAIFWIEYVIRHRGAAHLRSVAYRLPWYSYHSLDVAALLLALAGASLWAVLTACRLLRPRLVPRHRKA
ncbi:UDP-glucuronosyltransferase 2A1-like [Megalops cyprinoides]|uniref:UDP-glucuronosyltransferase 2A1-like n=1 Tax=Megalops cyprinoides TaxID=118141 RepID=UPI00186454DE|nr:UDP-glucuronosyltransferase 2A1-like [Megalops cyprinoides]